MSFNPRKTGNPWGVRRGINWDAQPLGQVSDGELARHLKVGRCVVAYARRYRGIAPWKPTTSLSPSMDGSASLGLRETILQILKRRYYPIKFALLKQEVLEDWPVSDKQIYRGLAALRVGGKVMNTKAGWKRI